ncbi:MULTISPECIES: BspA family leucine-rich repeat surface protein [unclassified Lactobacillus]|uniref:BspA family leucine-rich repeat surface protein n=1 Tax=unclassified Lactobacillus TaxID=2620435 RepID=UPI00226B09C1|nr:MULTISPECIES: BspA family leucine-rich repeat surface protein [unclassified Lactobacillus]MCO6530755.1 BspA family leucine-rich repeat surface protein [Lactobacillus sp.]MCX8737193.1 BspA family leucine-rich repeat surface protein [Lactobacillus sp. B4026]
MANRRKKINLSKKLLVSSAIAGIIGGTAVTLFPTQAGYIQTVQAKKKKPHYSSIINISRFSENNDCLLKYDVTTKTLHIKEGANSNTLGRTPIYRAVYDAKKHISKRNMFKPTDIEHISIDSQIKLPGNSSLLFGRLYKLQDISGLDKVDTGDVDSFEKLFYKDKSLQSLDLSSWDISSIGYAGASEMFSGAKSLTQINLTNWDDIPDTDMLSGLDTTKVKIIGFDVDED